MPQAGGMIRNAPFIQPPLAHFRQRPPHPHTRRAACRHKITSGQGKDRTWHFFQPVAQRIPLHVGLPDPVGLTQPCAPQQVTQGMVGQQAGKRAHIHAGPRHGIPAYLRQRMRCCVLRPL